MNNLIWTDRLFVRPWQSEDAESFFTLSQDQGLNSNTISSDQWRYRQSTVASARGRIEDWHSEFEKTKLGVWPVFIKSSNKLCGLCGIKPILPDGDPEPLWEMMYRFPTEYWGKGFATEVGAGLLEYGFLKVGLDVITAGVLLDNEPSKRVLRKLKFKNVRPIAILNVQADLFTMEKSQYVASLQA